MKANGVAYETLSDQELNCRYPKQFSVPSSSECVFEKDGGILKATKAVQVLQVHPSFGVFASVFVGACEYYMLRLFQELFVRHGGEILDGHRVTGIVPGSLVRVQTDKGDFRVKSLILTTGAWTNSLLKNIDLSLPYKANIALNLSINESGCVCDV